MRRPLLTRRIRGHSMVPVLPPGTVVWGFGWYRRLRSGDIVIFAHENKERIKRIAEVKAGQAYVLGDHITASKDSRDFGWLPLELVRAKVVWPRAPRSRAES